LIFSNEKSFAMTLAFRLMVPLLAVFFLCCGGKKEAAEPKPPPPPIDENLLLLVPYEADLVVWFDVSKLRGSQVWSLLEKALGTKGMVPSLDESLKNPLLACNEIVMAYLENQNLGNQLLILAKGDESEIAKMKTTFEQNADAKPVPVEELKGIWSERILLVPLTEQTLAFGNDAVVRMSVKTGVNKNRSIKENAEFGNFETGGEEALKLRYRSGVSAPVIQRFKSVVPRVNPDAVTGVDAEVRVETGFHLKVTVSTQTQMDASVIAEDLERARSELKNNMFVLFLGVAWILERIDVVSEKNVINVHVLLDDRDITELSHLMERLQKIQELLDDSGGPPFKNPMMRNR
jgi:hypothetical protein